MNTIFDLMFVDLLQGLAGAFPECKETWRTLQNVHSDPAQLQAIKADWKSSVRPIAIAKFATCADYLKAVRRSLNSTHLFNRLQLAEKYESMRDDAIAQTDFAELLGDLELYSADDRLVQLPKEEAKPAKKTKLRFDDPDLFKLCVQKLGDENLVREMQTFCLQIPQLNETYYDKSNEEIAQQMLVMKPLLPMVIRSYKMGMPIAPLIQIVTQFTKQWEKKNGIVRTKKAT